MKISTYTIFDFSNSEGPKWRLLTRLISAGNVLPSLKVSCCLSRVLVERLSFIADRADLSFVYNVKLSMVTCLAVNV